MTIAFDFSIEEIWPTWIAGAALVAGPNDSRKIGSGLAEFLIANEVTMLYCVPTLLATIDRDLPLVHTLIVGGEACPRDLVERWSVPGRRILNTYGPTETTVTATWGELDPGKPVTIGRPMPGYRIYIVDEHLQAGPPGESGEICIGGLGVARRLCEPSRTDGREVRRRPVREGSSARAHVPLGRPRALHARMAKSSSSGRIDSQVKIRGYRIELGEIEAVILEDPGVKNAIVSTVPVGQPAQDIAAYITLAPGCGPVETSAGAARPRTAAPRAGLHGAGLHRGSRRDSDAGQRQGRPQAPARAEIGAVEHSHRRLRGPRNRMPSANWRQPGRASSGARTFRLPTTFSSIWAATRSSRRRRSRSCGLTRVPPLERRRLVRESEHPGAGRLRRANRNRPSPPPRTDSVAPLQHSDARVRKAGLVQFGLAVRLAGDSRRAVRHPAGRAPGRAFGVRLHGLGHGPAGDARC